MIKIEITTPIAYFPKRSRKNGKRKIDKISRKMIKDILEIKDRRDLSLISRVKYRHHTDLRYIKGIKSNMPI